MSEIISETHTQSRGSDNELAYAAPVVPYWKSAIAHYGHVNNIIPIEQARLDEGLPPAHQFEVGELGYDGRKRRYLGCSDNSAKVVDGFIKELSRVGGPYLCSIPVQTFPEYRPDDFTSRTWAKSRIMIRVREILEKHHITTTCEPTFVGRQSVFNSEPDPVFTFLVYSDNAGHAALDAVKEIYDYLNSEGVRNFSVEICHPRCEKPRKTFPISGLDRITKCWEDVLDAIISSVDLADVIVIGCYRRGRSSAVENTLPTVLVIVESTSTRRNWKETREVIVGILSHFDLLDVAVEIVKDELRSDPSFTGTLNPVVLSGTAKIGESIAPGSDDSGSWTLGGFIELQSPVTQEWHVFGLTCFHCVVPDPDTVVGAASSFLNKMRIWCRDGIKFRDNETHFLFVNHPAVSVLRNEQARLEKEIHHGITNFNEGESSAMSKGKGKKPDTDTRLPFRTKSLETEKLVENIKTFIHKERQFFGHVIAGSGFGEHMKKPIGSGRMEGWEINIDWALVDIAEDRLPTNILGSSFVQQVPENTKLDLSRRTLYMLGHASGRRTEGHHNALPDYLINRRLVAGKQLSLGTIGYSILGACGTHFSTSGDTGAFVLTKEKYVVGMVNCRTYFNHITYFVHLEDLFSHILQTTSMAGVRIYSG